MRAVGYALVTGVGCWLILETFHVVEKVEKSDLQKFIDDISSAMKGEKNSETSVEVSSAGESVASSTKNNNVYQQSN